MTNFELPNTGDVDNLRDHIDVLADRYSVQLSYFAREIITLFIASITYEPALVRSPADLDAQANAEPDRVEFQATLIASLPHAFDYLMKDALDGDSTRRFPEGSNCRRCLPLDDGDARGRPHHRPLSVPLDLLGPAVSDEPNVKAVGQDAAKSLVTVAVAVLGLSATLTTALQGSKHGSTYFLAAWLGLVGAALFGWFTTGSIMHGLTKQKKTNAGLYLNLGLAVLVGSSVLLALGAHQAMTATHDDLSTALSKAAGAVTTTYPSAADVQVTEVDQSDTTITVALIDSTHRHYIVRLTRRPLEVTVIRRNS